MINEQRLLRSFLGLVRINSISRQEQQIAVFLKAELKKLGLKVRQDKKGNIIALLKGQPRLKRSILFNAHMDTVATGLNIKPIVKKGRIVSDGQTILGADDKAGIAAILEMLRQVREQRIAHGDIKVIFTVEEEIGLKGAKELKAGDVAADLAYVLDADGEVGTIVNRGPSQNILEIKVQGRPAHAGICPEKGINAIQLAAKAIAQLKLGRLDHETTANIGIIQGGVATNIVPEEVLVRGEARSHDERKLKEQVRHMVDTFARTARQYGGKAKIITWREYDRVAVPESSPSIGLAKAVSKRLGFKHRTVASGGGSDASIINALGVPTVALGIGMENAHSKNEYIEQKNLYDITRYIIELVKLANK